MIGRMEKIKRRDDKDEKRMGDILSGLVCETRGPVWRANNKYAAALVSSWLKIQKTEEFLFHL